MFRGVPRGGARGAMATPKPRLGGAKVSIGPPQRELLESQKVIKMIRFFNFEGAKSQNLCAFGAIALFQTATGILCQFHEQKSQQYSRLWRGIVIWTRNNQFFQFLQTKA